MDEIIVKVDASGVPGPAGPPGPQGEKGDRGETGPAGPQGIQGDPGPEGERGLQGIQGPEGPQGVQGPQGEQGIQGIKGDKGDKGDTGETGAATVILDSYATEAELRAAHPTGSPGDAYIVAGNLYVWAAHLDDWNNVGVIQGPQGPKGDTGDTGEQGPQGDIGPQGIQGIQGPQGLEGPAGYTPIKGTDYFTAEEIDSLPYIQNPVNEDVDAGTHNFSNIDTISALQFINADGGSTINGSGINQLEGLQADKLKNLFELLPISNIKLLVSNSADTPVEEMTDVTEDNKLGIVNIFRGSFGSGSLWLNPEHIKIVFELTGITTTTMNLRISDIYLYCPTGYSFSVEVYEPFTSIWHNIYHYSPSTRYTTIMTNAHRVIPLNANASTNSQYSMIRYVIVRTEASSNQIGFYSIHERGILNSQYGYFITYDGNGTLMPRGLNMGNNPITNVATPMGDLQAANRKYVDDKTADMLKKDGTVQLTASLDAGGNTIWNVREPRSDSDVANKKYVDNKISSITPELKGTAAGDINMGGYTLMGLSTGAPSGGDQPLSYQYYQEDQAGRSIDIYIMDAQVSMNIEYASESIDYNYSIGRAKYQISSMDYLPTLEEAKQFNYEYGYEILKISKKYFGPSDMIKYSMVNYSRFAGGNFQLDIDFIVYENQMGALTIDDEIEVTFLKIPTGLSMI